eukprot:CAMPEP_0170174552 /NCGR_PEP_ID=MMETSP0040_2-20121228/7779_1 /TAXON_ID=641309 /ORGANISM="Lotharella oceanica, Strain CCMP622" /LENGTH=114 /DNA_ID=CAMNT_0010416245 /DNA_START=644 /DNA_END=988 /DNA_ORIENTATION=-
MKIPFPDNVLNRCPQPQPPVNRAVQHRAPPLAFVLPLPCERHKLSGNSKRLALILAAINQALHRRFPSLHFGHPFPAPARRRRDPTWPGGDSGGGGGGEGAPAARGCVGPKRAE